MNFGVSRFRRMLPVACMSLAMTNVADIVDSMIAGRILGESALGAIELFWPWIEIVYFLALTMASGTSILYSDAMGRFDKKRASELFSSGIFVAVGTGLGAVLALVLCCDGFAAFFGVDAETSGPFGEYWRWYLPQAALFPLYLCVTTMVAADGDRHVVTASMIAEFAGNVLSSYILCRRMGVGGCALGTFCGTFLGLVVACGHFFMKSNSLRLRRHFSFKDAGRAFVTDLPSSSVILFTGLVAALMNKLLVAEAGDIGLAVLSTVVMSNGTLMLLYGIPSAAQPILCIYLGEGNGRAVVSVMRDAVRQASWMGLVLSGLMLAFPRVPAWLLGIDDPVCLAMSCKAVRIVGASYVFWGLGTLILDYYLYVGRAGMSMALATMQEFVFPVAGCWLGLAMFGTTGFWAGYAVSPVLSLAAFFLWLYMRRGRPFNPYLVEDPGDKVHDWTIVADEKSASETAQAIHARLEEAGAPMKTAVKVDLLVEDAIMTIKERNGGRRTLVELTLDLREGVKVTFRDNGVVAESFTDSGGRDWFRAQTMGSVIGTASGRRTALANGFNREEYSF